MEKKMFGTYCTSIDEKNRICIPSCTGIQKGERLLFLSSFNNRYITSESQYISYISDLFDCFMQKQICIEQYDYRSFMYILSSAVFKFTKADSQHRVTLTDFYQSNTSTAKIIGCGEYLKIIDKDNYIIPSNDRVEELFNILNKHNTRDMKEEMTSILDDKNRLCFPVSSGLIPGEEVYLISTGNGRYIIPEVYINNYLLLIKEQMMKVTKKEDYYFLNNLHEYLCSLITKKTTVNARYRIPANDFFLPSEGDAHIVGCGDYLKIINDENKEVSDDSKINSLIEVIKKR